jgi:hypothetical protein
LIGVAFAETLVLILPCQGFEVFASLIVSVVVTEVVACFDFGLEMIVMIWMNWSFRSFRLLRWTKSYH